MAEKFDSFSTADMMALTHSPAGQQLLALLQQSDSPQLRQAMEKAASGDLAGAKALLSPLLADARIRSLLGQLGGR